MKKISILTPDISHNCLGRAYLLAKVLQRHFQVEIVGPAFADSIWQPVANDSSISFKFIRLKGMLSPYSKLRELYQKIDGDIVYSTKPLLTSFGFGLIQKRTRKVPLILDIDDWQIGLIRDYYQNLSVTNQIILYMVSLIRFYRVDSFFNAFLFDKLIKRADGITVSNSFLQKLYGGTIVHHGKDVKSFSPERFDGDTFRARYGIRQEKKIIMYLGTPRPHKGLEIIIDAVASLKNEAIVFVIIGLDDSPYSNKLKILASKKLADNFMGLGVQPFEKIPKYLVGADLFVVHQKKTSGTAGQTPAKIFDAMALARPIIASNISNCSDILSGCGWVVEPENVEQLAEKIKYVLENQEEAQKMGINARKKCIDLYSWEAMERSLMTVFGKLC